MVHSYKDIETGLRVICIKPLSCSGGTLAVGIYYPKLRHGDPCIARPQKLLPWAFCKDTLKWSGLRLYLA